MVVSAIRAQDGEFRRVGFSVRVSGCWPRMDSEALSKSEGLQRVTCCGNGP
jgi:hypothetical protein